MAPRKHKYSAAEVDRRGYEIYHNQVRPLVAEDNQGRIVAVDIDSGAFEVDDNRLVAETRLRARFPEAEIWYAQIGHSGVDHVPYIPSVAANEHRRVPAVGDPIMKPRQRKYSKEEHARRGEEIYQQKVRPLVEEGNHGRIVAIDIDTGAYEVDDSTLAAGNRLFTRLPDAQVWYVRIGYPYVYRIAHSRKENLS
jgi:hypothetical protein